MTQLRSAGIAALDDDETLASNSGLRVPTQRAIKAYVLTLISAITSVTWGTIGGTITNQTDLISYISTQLSSYLPLSGGTLTGQLTHKRNDTTTKAAENYRTGSTDKWRWGMVEGSDDIVLRRVGTGGGDPIIVNFSTMLAYIRYGLDMNNTAISSLADATANDEAVNLGQLNDAIAGVVVTDPVPATYTSDHGILATDNHRLIKVDATGGAVTLTMPDPGTIDDGCTIHIKRKDFSANGVFLVPFNTETIEDDTGLTISNGVYENSYTLVWDSAVQNWEII